MPTPAETILAKAPLPTSLGSAEIREQIAAEVRERSLFSARTTEMGYLSRMQELLAQFAEGKINQTDFVFGAQRHLAAIGYDPEDEGAKAGSLQDRSSERRLKLILDTNIRQAQAVAQTRRSADPEIMAQWPAWRLARTGSRITPRDDWWQRWQDAGNSVGWEGAAQKPMVALKSSPIWAALGRGVGGYADTLGTAYPPFAYSSGLGWVDVPADEARRLGLSWQGADAAPAPASLAPAPNEYQAAFDRLPPDMQAQAKAWLEGGAA